MRCQGVDTDVVRGCSTADCSEYRDVSAWSFPRYHSGGFANIEFQSTRQQNTIRIGMGMKKRTYDEETS